MKPLIKISLIAAAAVFVSFVSCKKEAGFEGKKTIKGTVTLKSSGTAAEGAIVYIAFGTKEVTSAFNTSTTTDASGVYKFVGLELGDYFVDAKYTDANGFSFNTGGSSVEIKNSKDDVAVDLALE